MYDIKSEHLLKSEEEVAIARTQLCHDNDDDCVFNICCINLK